MHDEECIAVAEAHVCVFDEFSAGGKAFWICFQHLRSFYERGVYGYTLVGQDTYLAGWIDGFVAYMEYSISSVHQQSI